MNNPIAEAINAQIWGAPPALLAGRTMPAKPGRMPGSTAETNVFVATEPDPNDADPGVLHLRKFLRTVLPANGPHYFAATLPSAASPNEPPRNYACRSIEELSDRLLSLDAQGREVYFATASFAAPHHIDASGKSRQRCAENVSQARACWMDIDVGENKAANGAGYATQDKAIEALNAFCTKLGIQPTNVVSSGTGLHVYFSFIEPVAPVQWKRAATSLKHACAVAGLIVDPTRARDIASVLRPIMCTHRKDPKNPKPVTLLDSGALVEFGRFVAAVNSLHRGSRAAGVLQSGADLPLPAVTEAELSRSQLALAQIVDNGDLQSPAPGSSPWLRSLSPDEQVEVLESACTAIPVVHWSNYDDWKDIIAGFRGLHELGEDIRLDILQRHSERSPKWEADGWTGQRLREKFETFDGGSLRRLFELAEAHGWNRPNARLIAPFCDRATADDYFINRFMYVLNQGEYLDTNSQQLISAISLDESQSWLTKTLGESPRKILRASERTRRADSLGYHPGAGPVYNEHGKTYANLYVPWAPEPLKPTAAELELWNWFIEDQLFRKAEDKAARDYFLDALAYPLQNPGARVASVPLLIGQQYGSGKSTLMERVPRLIYGERNVTIATQSELDSGFNDWHANAQIICFPEIWMGGRDAKRLANDLKDKITNDSLRVHPKGLKGYSQPNRATLLGTSNFENAVHLAEGDRRWGVHITDAPKMAPAQAAALYGFLNSARAAGVLRYLFQTRNLSGFNAAGEPPLTAGKMRVIEASRSLIEAEIVEMFENGEPPFDRDLFVLEWVKESLRGRIPDIDHIAPKRLAEYVQTAPISAMRVGRKRIEASRPGNGFGTLKGKHNVWSLRNIRVWASASDREISRHLADGAPMMAVVTGKEPKQADAEPSVQAYGGSGPV